MAEQRWHPIFATVEDPTGTWTLLDASGRAYGLIEIRRVMNGTDVRYKCQFRGEVIGWATSLKLAVERTHKAFIAAHGPVPFAGYPDLSGSRRKKKSLRDGEISEASPVHPLGLEPRTH